MYVFKKKRTCCLRRDSTSDVLNVTLKCRSVDMFVIVIISYKICSYVCVFPTH